MGQNDEHLKLFVKQSPNLGTEGISAIGFGLGNKIEITKDRKSFQIAFCIDENEWNGKITTQFRLKDIKE